MSPRVKTKTLPNILSGFRIAIMPALLMAAVVGSRTWFVVLLAVSLTTDWLDGFLARRLNAGSDLGRKLDSAADYVTLITGSAGIALLWPEIVHRELPWVIAGLCAFFAVLAFGFVRFGRALGYHTWATKVLVVITGLSLIPLLSGSVAWPFHVAVVLQIVASLEQVAIAILLPQYKGEMPTLWHAWRLKQLADRPAEREQV
jgi:phosphatidylglycerophosphate synthase